jgi:hypothetical protein
LTSDTRFTPKQSTVGPVHPPRQAISLHLQRANCSSSDTVLRPNRALPALFTPTSPSLRSLCPEPLSGASVRSHGRPTFSSH